MVEIVLSIAIIGIAMVAIIGVLPLGLNVQTDNQEESIVSADASIWMEAIRSGAQGGEYLTNYVQEVRVDRAVRDMNSGGVGAPVITYTNYFTSASNLLGVLSLPKYAMDFSNAQPGGTTFPNGERVEHQVYADVRALNGNLADLASDADFAFKYRMFPELVPLQQVLTNNFGGFVTNANPMAIITTNLYELRLTFKWPLIVGTNSGYRGQANFQKSLTFRTLVGGQQMVQTNFANNSRLYFMTPRHYGFERTNSP